MNYIINPSVFYWISVVDGLKEVACGCFVLGIAALIVCTILFSIATDESEKTVLKIGFYVSIPLTIAGLLGVIFIPDKQTLIEMLIAKNVTVENAEWSLDALKQAVDYIAQAMK